jgi:hypothetical protein
MIIAKQVRRWQTLSLLSPASLIDRGQRLCPSADHIVESGPFDRRAKHRLKNRFSRRVSNGEAG